MTSRRTAVSTLAALAVLLLGLTGCLNTQAGLEVNSADDTVSGQVTLFATKAELTTNGKTKEQGFAEYRNKLPKLPQGKEVPLEDATNFGVQITYDHQPINSFQGNIRFAHNGKTYTFTVDLDPKNLAAALTGDPNNVGGANVLIQSTSFEITVSLPGQVTNTNGTLLGDNNVTWKFASSVTKPTQLTATSQVPDTPAGDSSASGTAQAQSDDNGGNGLLIVLLIVALVFILGLGAVVVLLFLRTRKSGTPPAGPGAGPGAPPPPPPPTPAT